MEETNLVSEIRDIELPRHTCADGISVGTGRLGPGLPTPTTTDPPRDECPSLPPQQTPPGVNAPPPTTADPPEVNAPLSSLKSGTRAQRPCL